MISISNLSRSYGNVRAVNNVSFQIDSGEVIGLLGPNGAGKTTIMKTLCGFLEPSAGRIEINGIDVAVNPKAAQSAIGYLPENLPIYPEMTVVNYLAYAAGLRGVTDRAMHSEIKRVIEATDLTDRAMDRVGALSRGLKQRVGVAQALLGSPKVLVLDEPTNGLDPNQAAQMRNLIRRLASTATVILSTHILSEVEAVCDRVLMVKGGQLVLDERLETLQRGSAVVLETSLDEQALAAVLTDLGTANPEISRADGVTRARIAADAKDIRETLAALARAVLAAEGDLYQLGFEHRNLESLFRDANHTEGTEHAA